LEDNITKRTDVNRDPLLQSVDDRRSWCMIIHEAANLVNQEWLNTRQDKSVSS